MKRIRPVIGNTLAQSVPVLFNFILSWIVIRYYGSAWWGEIVELQLAMYLAGSVCAWGNKEFLLRGFSHHPSAVSDQWKSSLTARGVFILLPVCVLLAAWFPFPASLHLVAWVFFRFIVQSFDSLVTYHRLFYKALWAEGLSITVMLSGFVLMPQMSYTAVLTVITLSQAARALGFALLVSGTVKWGNPVKPRLSMLAGSAGFASLALVGFMHTRSDMFCVVALLDESEVAYYQVYTAFLLFVQSCSNYLFQPYLKNFYRFTPGQAKKAHWTMIRIGIICVLGAMPFIYAGMTLWYGFPVSPALIVAGSFYAYAPFVYLPSVYSLYKMHRSWWVIGANIAGVALLVLLYGILFMYFDKNIINTLLVATIAHYIMAAGIIFFTSKLTARKEAAR